MRAAKIILSPYVCVTVTEVASRCTDNTNVHGLASWPSVSLSFFPDVARRHHPLLSPFKLQQAACHSARCSLPTLTLLALAAAFSPPPVFTPAEPAGTGTVRSFPDASLTMEQEQVQSWLWDTLSVSRLDLSVAVGEGYQERLAAEIEAEDQEEGEGYAGEGEGTFGEEGELILGPIESYAGDGNEKARAAAVAEFLKAEGKDGSYEARMDEFLQAGEGEGFYSGEENEGTFEEEGESYDMGMSRRGREQLNSWKAYIKTMEEGEDQ